MASRCDGSGCSRGAAAESCEPSSSFLCRINIDCVGAMIDHFFAVGDCCIAMVVSAINMLDNSDESSAQDRVASAEQVVVVCM